MIEMASNSYPWTNISQTPTEVLNLLIDFKVPPKFPSNLSIDAKDFLRNIFKGQPENRMNADQLLNHPWMHRDSIAPISSHNSSQNISRPFSKTVTYSPERAGTQPMIHQIKVVASRESNFKKKLVNILNESNNNSGDFSVSISVTESNDGDEEEGVGKMILNSLSGNTNNILTKLQQAKDDKFDSKKSIKNAQLNYIRENIITEHSYEDDTTINNAKDCNNYLTGNKEDNLRVKKEENTDKLDKPDDRASILDLLENQSNMYKLNKLKTKNSLSPGKVERRTDQLENNKINKLSLISETAKDHLHEGKRQSISNEKGFFIKQSNTGALDKMDKLKSALYIEKKKNNQVKEAENEEEKHSKYNSIYQDKEDCIIEDLEFESNIDKEKRRQEMLKKKTTVGHTLDLREDYAQLLASNDKNIFSYELEEEKFKEMLNIKK